MELYKVTIPGKLPCLNDYTAACNNHWSNGYRLKRDTEEFLMWQYLSQLPRGLKMKYVHLSVKWIEPNKKRDYDNICFAKKYLLDALQKSGFLENDNRKFVDGFTDSFAVDEANPRIEIIFEEKEKANDKQK